MLKANLTMETIMEILWDGGEIHEHPCYSTNRSIRHSQGIGAFAHLVSKTGEDLGPVHWATWKWLADNGFLKEDKLCLEPVYQKIWYKKWTAQ